MLRHFDDEAGRTIHTDARNKELVAVLAKIEEGVERVAAYASRVVSKTEVNYSMTEEECLALVWAITK